MTKKTHPRRPPNEANPQGDQPWLDGMVFSRGEILRYLEAANRCGLEVSHWARQMLNAAAADLLGDQEHRDPSRRR